MEKITLCNVCKRNIANYNCRMCGKGVCGDCYNKGLCTDCRIGRKA